MEEQLYLIHYGIPRRSGRYPWGSGESNKNARASRKAAKEEYKQKLAEIKRGGHYSSTSSKTTDDEEIDLNRANKLERKELVKNRRVLTTAELSDAISRIKMEKELVRLSKEDLSPGRTMAEEILKYVATDVGKKVLSAGTMYSIRWLLTKEGSAKEFANYAIPLKKEEKKEDKK